MLSDDNFNAVSEILLQWYDINKRDLPWRDESDPYCSWISEVILQQTRVNQGLEYYIRFIDRFPTVSDLALAQEDEVLKYWQGLGYYSRARNLHKAAQQVMTEFAGQFPTEYSDVLKLSGIGEYTAAAICSIAYNQPYAAVDGNVYRVLSRIFGIETPIDTSKGKRQIAELAQSLIPALSPGVYNQAIMDFGALQCVPVSPECNICPFKGFCRANEMNLTAQLPVKSKKTKVTHRYFNYLFIQQNGYTYLQKRTAKDVWQNLYEFPLIESDHLLSPEELVINEVFKSMFDGIGGVKLAGKTNPMKHVLSHRVINAQFVYIHLPENVRLKAPNLHIQLSEIDEYAVSRLTEIFLENNR